VSVVDSSGWIEFLIGSENGEKFRPALQSGDLVVPTVVIVEVRRWLAATQRAADLVEVTNLMVRGQVISLDAGLAVAAADLGVRYRLPLADSIVYATAQSRGLEVWTQDRDFEGLPGVRFVPKTPA
jgi:predicted nucleic acid-binding protein